MCIHDHACHPASLSLLSPPLRQSRPPPSPPPPSFPCRATGPTRKPGPPTQLRLAPLPGSCEFAVASWLPLQDATGCNGAQQQVEVRPTVGGDWTQAVVETVNATAVLVLGLEVGLGLLYRFRLRSRWREHWIAGESTGVRFADGSSPLAAPRVTATSSASVLLNWSRGLGCDEGTHWSVQVARARSFPARNGLLPAPAQWETLGNSSATVVAYPLVCTNGCVFRVRLLTSPEAGFGDASERVLTPALPSVAPNAVRTLLTLRAEPRAAQNADWQLRFAHALEKRLRVPRVTVVEVQRLLGPERWVAVDLLSDSKANSLRLAMHLPTALRDGTLDGSELDAVTAAVRLLPDGTHQFLEVQGDVAAEPLSRDVADDVMQVSQAWTFLIEAMQEHKRTLALLAGAIALLTCAGAVVCLCYCRARRRTRLWAGELASRIAARRRSKGHTRLRHEEEGSWGCGDAVPSATDDEIGPSGHLASDDDESTVYVTSVPGVRPLCTRVKRSDLRRQPTASCLKDALVRIGFQACNLPFASDDAARIEYVTAAGERVQLTQASSVPWVTSRALEYRVILSSAATSSGSTHVGLGATLMSF